MNEPDKKSTKTSISKVVTFERTILVIQTIVIILGFLVAYVELKNIQQTTSGNLALEIYKDIRSDRVFKNNPKIIEAIASGKSILKANGGNFEEEDLDNYLGFFDWISAANDMGIVSDDMVYNFHGDLILSTYNNQEIKSYINDLMKEDNKYYAGFLWLVEKIKKLDGKVD